MFFKQNVSKETLQILLTENKRLKQENQRLRDFLHEIFYLIVSTQAISD